MYADSSALTKLVAAEPETKDLRRSLLGRPPVVTSGLARVEVRRAVARVAPTRVELVDRLFEEVTVLELDEETLDRAARIGPPALRSLDAIHLASAEQLGDDLDLFIAYDERLLAAAEAHGFSVASPGRDRPGAVP